MPRKVVPEWNSRGRSERTENEVLKETELIKLEDDQISTMVVEIFAH